MSGPKVIAAIVAEMREISRNYPAGIRNDIAVWANRIEQATQPPASDAGDSPKVLDIGFRFEDGKHTPTVLVGFTEDDWTARDRFAATLTQPGEVVAWLRHGPDGSPDWAEDCIAPDQHILDYDQQCDGYTLRPLTYADTREAGEDLMKKTPAEIEAMIAALDNPPVASTPE